MNDARQSRRSDQHLTRRKPGAPSTTNAQMRAVRHPAAEQQRAKAFRMFCSRPMWSELDTTEGSW